MAAAVAPEDEDAVPPGAAWVLDLVALLLTHESASGAVDALVDTMKAGPVKPYRKPIALPKPFFIWCLVRSCSAMRK